MASDLISKLLAAGLSAGVFLIWWPEHHATAGLASLVVRGALWTLTYELLLVAFTPLERLGRRAIAARAHRLRPRNPFAAVPGPARVGGACVLACAGAALPLALLAGAQGPSPARAATTTKRVVVVKRPIVKRVVVRETVTVPAAAAHPSPPVLAYTAARTRSTRATPAPRRAAKRRTTPAATTTAPPETMTGPAVPATTAPATTSAPAAPTTADAPAQAPAS
jgi:hypothetical protein